MASRILVTGSRDWDDCPAVDAAIKNWIQEHPDPASEPPVIVHGACPTGADCHADLIARQDGYRVERHPAQWTRYGRAAGPIRNAEMVEAGADVCLAFIKDSSPGATGCAVLAESAGIRTIYYRQDTT